MEKLIVKCDSFIMPSGIWSGYIACADGKIVSVTKDKPGMDGKFIDATGFYVSPGFIDIHTHGAGGADFMDGDAESFITAVNTHMRHGTTTILPTTVAADIERIHLFIENFHEAKKTLGDVIFGAHIEGPYCNSAQAGALDPTALKDPCEAEYKRVIEMGNGVVKRWSIAPELPGALEMGDYLNANGCIPSIAHSAAEYQEVLEARNHHYTLITHLYSCTSTIIRKSGYRFPGVMESAYILDDLDAEIIADGHHLPIELLKLVYKSKGPEHIAMCTDSMRAAGAGLSESILGGKENGIKIIIEDGVAKLADRSSFAGSVATADQLVRVMHKKAGVDIVNTVAMITKTPARILGIQNKKGVLAVNMDSDMVVFNDDIEIQTVISGGVVKYQR